MTTLTVYQYECDNKTGCTSKLASKQTEYWLTQQTATRRKQGVIGCNCISLAHYSAVALQIRSQMSRTLLFRVWFAFRSVSENCVKMFNFPEICLTLIPVTFVCFPSVFWEWCTQSKCSCFWAEVNQRLPAFPRRAKQGRECRRSH